MRAKFKCQSVADMKYEYQDGPSQVVKFSAVYGGDKNHEDNQFSKATPSGNFEMQINNPSAIDFFKAGKSYYIDFTEAER